MSTSLETFTGPIFFVHAGLMAGSQSWGWAAASLTTAIIAYVIALRRAAAA